MIKVDSMMKIRSRGVSTWDDYGGGGGGGNDDDDDVGDR